MWPPCEWRLLEVCLAQSAQTPIAAMIAVLIWSISSFSNLRVPCLGRVHISPLHSRDYFREQIYFKRALYLYLSFKFWSKHRWEKNLFYTWRISFTKILLIKNHHKNTSTSYYAIIIMKTFLRYIFLHKNLNYIGDQWCWLFSMLFNKDSLKGDFDTL